MKRQKNGQLSFLPLKRKAARYFILHLNLKHLYKKSILFLLLIVNDYSLLYARSGGNSFIEVMLYLFHAGH